MEAYVRPTLKTKPPQVPEAVSQVPMPVPSSSHRATESFLSSTRSHRHLPLAPSCSSGQGPVRPSDPITQTQSLHSLAGTLGHTPDDKQPGPSLQTRTGATGCWHGRQRLPAPPCEAEALHRAQRAWLVSCKKETEVVKGPLQGLQLFGFQGPEYAPASIAPGWAVSALLLIAPTHHLFIYSLRFPLVRSFSGHLSCFCLLGPCWYKVLSQVLRIPQELGHADHTPPRIGKGKLTKP